MHRLLPLWRKVNLRRCGRCFFPMESTTCICPWVIVPISRVSTLASLDSSERKFIVATNANAAYVQSGQLLFMRGGVLMAQPFDLRSMTLGGEPRPIANTTEMGHINRVRSATSPASPNTVLVGHAKIKPSHLFFQRSNAT